MCIFILLITAPVTKCDVIKVLHYRYFFVLSVLFIEYCVLSFTFFFSIIMSVRETCADWPRQFDPVQDPALKGKKDPDAGFNFKVPRRNVGECSSNMWCMINHQLFQ